MPRMTLRPTIRGTSQIVGVVLAAAAMLSAVTEGRQVGAASRGAIVQTPPGRSSGVILELVREGDFEAIMGAVLAAAGHPRLVVRIRASDNVKTAGASIEAGRKVIEFNPGFLARLTQRAQTDWSTVLVLSMRSLTCWPVMPYPGPCQVTTFGGLKSKQAARQGF
jgi:hypothetical protein